MPEAEEHHLGVLLDVSGRNVGMFWLSAILHGGRRDIQKVYCFLLTLIFSLE
ncbi:hypothetical protein MICA_1987 [Micavibrio aeruginosavorus ARL-13]|uniref:Uncharacterized protein n=1 Tax=Micavibrio aeruginosavorus (strain ARL-13) TaxID=856793 RepID=G2KNQ0_MICAA|nr:hypothetical protein MICA_1987 [Micavibrio aeruginosavorus ARL-13]